LDIPVPCFPRFFKLFTGHVFIILIHKLGIQRPCRLLLQPDMSVSDICFEVGYPNLPISTRHFRVKTAQTPSDYRRVTAVTLFKTARGA
ncbi:AraC family transcriptional regulator, partial [Pseudomonas floridensis]